MDEHLIEKGVSSREIYRGRIFTVRQEEVELPNGSRALRDIVDHSGGVGVLPLTDRNNVYMVRQYRRPNDEVLLEIPAGKRNPGEDPKECGIRELEEETGMTAGSIRYLGVCRPTPAYCSEDIHLYLATDLHSGEKHLDDGEFLDVIELPLSRLVQMVLNGEIVDAKTQIAILKTNELLNHSLLE